jgi:exodeoxyribonuclease-1
MVRAATLFAPNAITIPLDDTGMPSFKLHRVGPANGFDHSSTHDALGDVQATLHLCRLLSERAPDLWSNFLRFTQKAAVVDHVNNESIFCLTDFYGGVPYSWVVTSIGLSTSRKSDILVFDLSADPDELRVLSDDELVGRLVRSPTIIRRVRSNACPIIVPWEMAPDIAAAKALSDTELERRTMSLRRDQEFGQRLIVAFEQTADERDPWPHVEQQIHDAFISNADEKLLDAFHGTPWEQRLALLDELEDGRLKQLGRRLIFLERPDVLSDRVRQKMTASLARRLIDGDGAGTWLCLQRAIQEADDLISLATDKQRLFLLEHRDYLAKRLQETSQFLA